MGNDEKKDFPKEKQLTKSGKNKNRKNPVKLEKPHGHSKNSFSDSLENIESSSSSDKKGANNTKKHKNIAKKLCESQSDHQTDSSLNSTDSKIISRKEKNLETKGKKIKSKQQNNNADSLPKKVHNRSSSSSP